ncbi:MAG: metallophosphoesterase, partial [Flavisolibacter sp.]|nr:metallophosphoesterase [Flavisolibacter sp.]
MQRRKFIQNIAFLTGGLISGSYLPAKAFFVKGEKIKGQVTSKGKGLKDVIISDGYTVVATDKKGKFEMEPHPDALALFMSTPSGYAFIEENGIARHYRLIQEMNL